MNALQRIYQGKHFSMFSDAGNDAVAQALQKHIIELFEKKDIMTIIESVQQEVAKINPEVEHLLDPLQYGEGEVAKGFGEVHDTAVRESIYMYLNHILDKDD